MRLTQFSVTNYRSITKAHKVKIGEKVTVLVGKNNEGKSNLLKALALAMDIMVLYGEEPTYLKRYYKTSHYPYNWDLDFPIALKEKKSISQNTTIELEFLLNSVEKGWVTKNIGIRIGDTIPVRVTLRPMAAPTVDVPKKGSSAFREHSQELAAYVCKRMSYNYIPAIRTEDEAMREIQREISNSLIELENNTDYLKAIEIINNLQQQVFDKAAIQIQSPLSTFLPNVTNVEINLVKDKFKTSLRHNFEIMVDDGNNTPLQFKGDGVKSLTAIALLSNRITKDKACIIAIEEPESHLHPEALHQLNETIMQMAENNQVILTTHNQAFVNRSNYGNNVIVGDGKAVQATSIKQIRDVLGLIYSDNLINANIALVVEGETEVKVLNKLLPQMSPIIKRAIANGELIIDEIGGAGKLSYKLSLYRNSACRYHVLLDNDEAGKNAYEDAEQKKILSIKDTTFLICKGNQESELEDCINPQVYKEVLLEEFGIDIDCSAFKGKKKWSLRMEECCNLQGKIWTKTIAKQVKTKIADAIVGDVDTELDPYKRDAIDSLVKELERKIGTL